jgi:hypothetical protein
MQGGRSDQHYRAEAERARQRARESKLPGVREAMLAAAAQFEWLANQVSNLLHHRRSEEQTLATLHSLNPPDENAESATDRHPETQTRSGSASAAREVTQSVTDEPSFEEVLRSLWEDATADKSADEYRQLARRARRLADTQSGEAQRNLLELGETFDEQAKRVEPAEQMQVRSEQRERLVGEPIGHATVTDKPAKRKE